ncbi:MAG: Ig-like domain repeat protein [Pyrinomonadaceae bacterium]
MKRIPRPARGIRHTSTKNILSTQTRGRLAVLLVLALAVAAAAASLASRAQAQKKRTAGVESAAATEVLRPASGPVRSPAGREAPDADLDAPKTDAPLPAALEDGTPVQLLGAKGPAKSVASASAQAQGVPVLTRQNAPDIPQCRELVRQDVLDIANAAVEDPAVTFERHRREHPHMVMIPPTLDCASKFWQAARHGGRLPDSAQDPDAITARQNPIETFFNLGALNAAIGTNVDPSSGVEGYQGENFISIDPNNPQHIVAHSNTFFKDPNPQCQSPTGGSANTFGSMALFGSTDGGATWTYNCAPWPAAVTGGVTGAAVWFGSDPALAWDNQGRAYATYMLLSQNASGSVAGASIVVSRSSDTGASWSYLGTVVNGITNSAQFNDKEMMAIDNTSGQTFSHPGRIFVIWDANNVERVAYSDDGSTWSTVLLPSGTAAIGGNVVVGADGTVYVIWTRFNIETIVFSKSTDGGATWTAPSVIATLALQSFGANNKPPAQNVRGINGFGSIDIDRNTSSPYFGNLYVAFPDFPAGTTSGVDINTYVIRSTNGGTNWSSRLKVNDDNFGATQIFPWLAVDQTDGAVHVSWYDSRLDPINRKTQAVTARSIDGGVSFEPNLLVTDGGTDWRNNVNYSDENSADNTTFNSNQYGDYMGIAAINRQVHPLWTDSRMFFPVADTHSPTRREDNASAAVTYCTAPTTINAPNVNPSTTPSVVVSWSAPAGWGTNATNGTYSVYRNTTNSFPGGSPLASGLTATSYIDTTGVGGTTYYYFIRAKNNCPGTALTPMTTDSNASAAVNFGDAGTPTGTLQGTVTAGGSPVVGAVVTAGTYSATTDASGFYQIPGIGAGTYTVATSPAGYSPASVNGVNVTGGATTVQNLALTGVTTASCFTDTTYNDFTAASSASGVEIVSSPGDVKLANAGAEGQDQVSSPAALVVGNTPTATTWSGQTFRAGITGNLTKITVGLGLNSGSTGTVTVEIRDINGVNPGTTVLATGTLGPVTNVGTAVLYTTTFTTPAAVVSGTSYSVVLKGNTGSVFSVRGSTGGGSTLANGQFFTTTTSGTTWAGVAADLFFTTYVTPPINYPATGNLVSSVKDANSVSGVFPRWTTLSWTATTPANTSVQFQAAASNDVNGPFNFVGPDGTAATFFTTSGASLSQFNGFRYLKYKAILNTSNTASTPTLNDVTVCFDSKRTQAISFDTLGDKTYGDADFQLTATSTSGLTVSYSTSGNCTVTGDMVHLTGAGSCTITAMQAGDSTYNAAANVPRSFNIAKAATTTGLVSNINPSNTGQLVTFTATVSESVAAADAAGTVDFIDTSNGNAVVCGGVSLTSGQAQCMTSTLAAGTHNVQAVYSGNTDFVNSTSAAVPQVVNAALSVLDAKVAEPSTGTAQMLFTVSLSAPAGAGGVTVSYATADDTGGAHPATAGTDYTQVTATTLTFQPGEMVKVVPIPVLHDADSGEPDETFLLQLSSPANATISRATATGTITQVNTPGTFIISELRTRGPAGDGDDFVELYNNTDSPLTVNGLSGGYGVFAMGAGCTDTPVLVGIVPNGTVIPARGHYLLVGSAYSLGSYAAGDLSMASDIADDRNVAVFSTANVAEISSANRLDAVGFGQNVNAAVVFNSKTPSLQKLRSRMSVLSSGNGTCDLLREGTTLPVVSGTATEHSFFRNMNQAAGGNPKDTNDNAADFVFADTMASNISGVPRRLGAPGPENLASPIRRDTSGIGVLFLDGTKGTSAAPNRDRDTSTGNPSFSSFGTLMIRRRVVNNTGATVTRLRFRIVEMTTYPSPAGTADLRALTSSPVVISGIGDPATCAATGTPTTVPCQVTAQATTLEQPPTQSVGGGINSTLSVSIPGGLAPNASIDVNFTLGVQQTGTFRFLIIVEALP